MKNQLQEIHEVIVLMAGDSGDGVQLMGEMLSHAGALSGNDVSTFPTYPAEIRAPQGSLHGVSGFQIRFSDEKIFSPGDQADVLIAMNPAALRQNQHKIKHGGILIANVSAFDKKNLELAGYTENPLPTLREKYKIYSIEISRLVKELLNDSRQSSRTIERSKNMFLLGFLCWIFNKPTSVIESLLEQKFKASSLLELNRKSFQAGYHYGETTESIDYRIHIKKAALPAGRYRNISGNKATALGLIAAAQKARMQLFYASYPITPASDILHELSLCKHMDVITYQAEDEIAAICAALGASFGGNLGVTATAGPGMSLKTEALGLAVMTELPLVVCDIQRSGPSTGMPTKTEQADLFQALFGRHGEAPLPVIAAAHPADCFEVVYEASRIAIEHMTPVIFLSDAYIANAMEPWKIPGADDLPPINPPFIDPAVTSHYQPYQRNKNLVRQWALPGQAGYEHVIGGLEKEDISGKISYDPENHQAMVFKRKQKIEKIAETLPLQRTESGPKKGKLAVVGWGSTYGAIKTACRELTSFSSEIAHIHLRYLYPFPQNLVNLLQSFERILVPELNTGQLAFVLEAILHRPVYRLNKVKGIPFTAQEIKNEILKVLQQL